MDKNERLDPNDYGTARPRLEPDEIPADKAVLTIIDVEKVDVEDKTKEDGIRHSVVLTFKEYPDKAHWLNKTQISALVVTLGDLPAKWIGERVPLEKVMVNDPRTKKRVEKLYISSPDDWDKLLKGKKR